MKTEVSGSGKETNEDKDPVTQLIEKLRQGDPPWGFLIFEQNGSVSSLCASEKIIGEENASHVMMALDFAHFAFERPDWMLEYVKSLRTAKAEKEESSRRPKLELIKGGLEDE